MDDFFKTTRSFIDQQKLLNFKIGDYSQKIIIKRSTEETWPTRLASVNAANEPRIYIATALPLN